jgi:hypothetical protein
MSRFAFTYENPDYYDVENVYDPGEWEENNSLDLVDTEFEVQYND